MESPLSRTRMKWDHELENRKCLEINGAIFRFMESRLFQNELRTDHEPNRVGGVLRGRKQCGRCDPLVPCARWKDWFRWWTSAHFGELLLPVGEVCLFQNTPGLLARSHVTNTATLLFR